MPDSVLLFNGPQKKKKKKQPKKQKQNWCPFPTFDWQRSQATQNALKKCFRHVFIFHLCVWQRVFKLPLPRSQAFCHTSTCASSARPHPLLTAAGQLPAHSNNSSSSGKQQGSSCPLLPGPAAQLQSEASVNGVCNRGCGGSTRHLHRHYATGFFGFHTKFIQQQSEENLLANSSSSESLGLFSAASSAGVFFRRPTRPSASGSATISFFFRPYCQREWTGCQHSISILNPSLTSK